MKIRIIKKVQFFEKDFQIGKIYDAKKADNWGGAYCNGRYISRDEYEIVK